MQIIILTEMSDIISLKINNQIWGLLHIYNHIFHLMLPFADL